MGYNYNGKKFHRSINVEVSTTCASQASAPYKRIQLSAAHAFMRNKCYCRLHVGVTCVCSFENERKCNVVLAAELTRERRKQ